MCKLCRKFKCLKNNFHSNKECKLDDLYNVCVPYVIHAANVKKMFLEKCKDVLSTLYQNLKCSSYMNYEVICKKYC